MARNAATRSADSALRQRWFRLYRELLNARVVARISAFGRVVGCDEAVRSTPILVTPHKLERRPT